MDTAGPLDASKVSPPTRWSLYVGLYTLACAAAVLLLINQVSELVAQVVMPMAGPTLLLASPVPLIAAGIWWAVVEQHHAFTYVRGCLAAVATALITIGFWILIGAAVWSPAMVLNGWPLVVAVVVPVVPAAPFVGLPIMYVRRRRANGQVAANP